MIVFENDAICLYSSFEILKYVWYWQGRESMDYETEYL